MHETFYSKLVRWWNNPSHFLPEVWSSLVFNVRKYPRLSYFMFLVVAGWITLEVFG